MTPAPPDRSIALWRTSARLALGILTRYGLREPLDLERIAKIRHVATDGVSAHVVAALVNGMNSSVDEMRAYVQFVGRTWQDIGRGDSSLQRA